MIAYRAVEEKEEWNQALKVILYILIVAAGMALAYFLKTDYAENIAFFDLQRHILHRFDGTAGAFKGLAYVYKFKHRFLRIYEKSPGTMIPGHVYAFSLSASD